MDGIDRTARMVSLTPLALSEDSRTLRMAVSLARRGHHSIVVQNRAASDGEGAPDGVHVVSLLGARWGRGESRHPRPDRGWIAAVAAKLKQLVPESVGDIIHLAVFALLYLVVRPCEGLVRSLDGDTYYLHEYRLYPLVAMLRRRRPAALVYDAHDFYARIEDRGAGSPVWRRLFVPLLAAMERRCIAAADAIVTVSDGIAALIEKAHGVRPLVIRNCHDARLDRLPARDLRTELGLNDGVFLVAVVGTRRPWQPVDAMIAAVRELPPSVHVAFVGDLHEATVATAKARGVGDRVHAVGFVDPVHIVPFIAASDASILLRHPHGENSRHALANAFFQYLAAGLPVLYGPLPEVAKLMDGAGAGIEIDPSDAASIRDAVRRLLDHPDQASALGAAARRLGTLHSWKNEEKKLFTLINDLLQKRRRATQ